MRALEQRGLFDFEVVCPTPLPTAAVVVVDPFSSGSILAARVLHYKLRLVMVFSEASKGVGGKGQGFANQPRWRCLGRGDERFG